MSLEGAGFLPFPSFNGTNASSLLVETILFSL